MDNKDSAPNNSSIYSYIYNTIFPPQPDSVPDRTSVRSRHAQPLIRLGGKANANMAAAEKLGQNEAEERKTSAATESLNADSILNKLKVDIDQLITQSQETLEQLGNLANQVQETCGPYTDPVRRLGNIADNAWHSEAADEVKDQVQLKVLESIEQMLKSLRPRRSYLTYQEKKKSGQHERKGAHDEKREIFPRHEELKDNDW